MKKTAGRKQKKGSQGSRKTAKASRAKPAAAKRTAERSSKKTPARKRRAASATASARKATAAAQKRRPAFPIESPDRAEILLRLEELLRQRILGKDDAIERVARALRVRLTHLDFRPERPNGAFLMVGPPGVGKNEFAYALANILYADETAVVPIDMRAITSEEDVNRLTDSVLGGPQPILLEGHLSTPFRRRPHSILLLRGIEHAHPAAHRLIQQIIAQGWIDDARGRVFFQEAIIFATSRVPDDETGPTSEIGFTREMKTYEDRVRAKLDHRFGEEFVEAFEEVVILSPLSPDDVRRIAQYKVAVVLQRLREASRGVEVSESVFREFIPDEEARRAGAGLLNRTLETKLLNPLARYLLEHPQERAIRVDVRDGALVIESAQAAPRLPARRAR